MWKTNPFRERHTRESGELVAKMLNNGLGSEEGAENKAVM